MLSKVDGSPKSTCHHGCDELAVCVTDLPLQTPLVLPSTARLATPLCLVLLCSTLLPSARFVAAGLELFCVVVIDCANTAMRSPSA